MHLLEFSHLLTQTMQFPQFIPPPCEQCTVHALLGLDTTLEGLQMSITSIPKRRCPVVASHLSKALKVIRHENDDCLDLFGSERAFVLRMDRCDACKTGIPCHCLFGACSPCNQNTGCVHSQARERPCSLSVHRKLDTQTCSGMRNSKNETPASHLLATTWMEGHFSRWIKS